MNNAALAPFLGNRSFEDHKAEFDERGYLVFDNVLDADMVSAYRAALEPHLDTDLRGRNDFEGISSNRVYAMLAKDPIFADMVMHPLPMAFARADLGPSFLLSACLAINLLPGETVQPWHTDDGYVWVDLPHPAFGLSAFWALTDTTVANGATQVLPGSHLWAEGPQEGALSNISFDINDKAAGDPGAHPDAVSVELSAGSVILAKGTMWHRGGANTTNEPRLIVTPQYCAGWMRQIENMAMSIPPEVAATYPERLREMIGYSIHPPFIGYVDGMHPRRRLTGQV